MDTRPRYSTTTSCPLRVVILEVTAVKRNKLWAVWENSEERKECPEGRNYNLKAHKDLTVKKDIRSGRN